VFCFKAGGRVRGGSILNGLEKTSKIKIWGPGIGREHFVGRQSGKEKGRTTRYKKTTTEGKGQPNASNERNSDRGWEKSLLRVFSLSEKE